MVPDRVLILPAYMAGLHATATVSAVTFARHTHDIFGVGVIRRGAQRSASGRGMVEAGAGDVITVNPGEVHDGAPIDGTRAWQMVYLEPALVCEAAADAGIPSPAMVEFRQPVIRDDFLAVAMLRLFHAAIDAGATALRREEALSHLLDILLADHDSRRPADARAPGRAIRARRRLQDDPAASVSLAELATDCGLSRFHLIRAFRRETGLTPHAYQVSLRCRRRGV